MDSFARMVQDLTPKLVSVAKYYVLENAEDVVQEVWEKVWKNKDMLCDKKNAAAWLVCVTKHHCIDHMRKHKSSKDKVMPLSVDDYINVLASDNFNPETDYLDSESNSIMLRYIHSVSEIYGIPIKLFYYDGLSIKDIAELLDLTNSTIKWRLFTGRQLIKKLIIKDGYYYG